MGRKHDFNAVSVDAPSLPDWLTEAAFSSGHYPYDKRMKRKKYESRLTELQIELAKLQAWLLKTGHRAVIVFEGRDAAGKGGTIKRVMQHINPRHAHVVALSKPTETERGQWYFQRYIDHLPTTGEMTLYDRSWYNRAVVEPVMGFCTPAETVKFLEETPTFEQMLVKDGITLIKFWLNVGREMQFSRLHARQHDPLKQWKLSPIDIKGLGLWDAYTEARNKMFAATHTTHAPWTVVKSNDKMRARLNVIATILNQFEYGGEHQDVDPLIVGEPELIADS